MPASRPPAWLCAAAAAALLGAGPARAVDPAPVRLVLVVAVDQLRPDRLHAALPGGLGRLVREGRVFADAALAHGITETCPGHATMLTGRHPASAGIPANEFFADDPEVAEPVYCAFDPRASALEIGGESGLSPASLRADALGDWLKRASPASRVFAVAGKDRAAIMLGGQHPDGAYWFRSGDPPGFTTSRYYREALPAWVLAWNGAAPPADGFLAALPERWEHEASDGARAPDDFPGEATRTSRTSPHPLRDPDLGRFAEQLFLSPYLDLATLDFAERLALEEGLGRGPAPDLLALSLSATDSVGHLFGPASREAGDALHRLDLALGRFLDHLEARTGGALLVALTADHGVLPLPEWLAANGEARCPEPSGRAGIRRIGLGLLAHLWWELGPLARPGAWLHFAGSQARVDRRLARRQEVAPERAADLAKAYLESWPAIGHVWTGSEIASGAGELAELYRRSFVPGRSGDLVVQAARGCLLSTHDTGTSHGSPWEYDRRVPLLFRGRGVAAGTTADPAATVDIAPTLAALLGLSPPADLDGRVLLLR
jgi:predicted AlkP superfamily pyrophosphatase or phosphodiesterase